MKTHASQPFGITGIQPWLRHVAVIGSLVPFSQQHNPGYATSSMQAHGSNETQVNGNQLFTN